ncbi:multiple C2 and transmembrane domain-containing protein 1-like [Panicum miliaceum]|uniref:Multiple C2 and transmembrane domain-containing protein 1-like n=1 Tax=Panicum miliaceum TaxID=4540 RepID=A0A3L6PIL0_PANMI|nr:multiple C2 and transmembrane domain-containing protein 1-like [Panicum miliaceum]
MKLVVEVAGARDLPARRGRGGVSPFVQVAFGGQRHATAVRPPGEANPTWNETLVFAVDARTARGARSLSDGSIDVGVYHRRASGGKSCLGRVRLFGAAVAPSAEEAVLLRCPLDKPSFFASARGEVALRLYLAPYASPSTSAAAANAPAGNAYSSTYATTTFNDTASMDGPGTVVGGASTQSAPATIKRKTKKKEPVQVFHSIPTQSSTGSLIFPPPPPPPFVPPTAGVQAKGADKKAPAPATADDAKAAEYLMVDKLEFLYVNVVRASNLPGMDLTLGIDPYVEVRVGNYSAATRHAVRNHYPEWNQVFAFSKDHLQSDVVEVIVKDRNLIVWDSFVGKVVLPIVDVPSSAPPNRPPATQWYGLKGAKDGQWTGGEIMLAAWKGSQSDEAFAGALHASAHDLSPSAVAATQAKSYHAPRLCYLRCHVMAAQDLVHPDRGRSRPSVFARVQLGAQRWETRASPSARWDQDFFLVAAWPFEEPLEITVMDGASPGRHEVLGRLVLPKSSIKVQQFDKKKFKQPAPSWFDLEGPHSDGNGGGDGRDRGWRHEFRSKIQLCVYYDAAYHVLDELTTYASDFEPSAKQLRKPAPVGVLELAVLRATGLPSTKKRPNGGRAAVDAYCVAKYGQKWVRTRTLVDTASPSWQEQFTFDVFDPCTALTVAVFDSHQLVGVGEDPRRGATDAPLGKVRIRVSTLGSGRRYEQPHPLFVLRPDRLARCGELHLAVRFTPTAWVSMLSLYLRPTLPNQHYAKPIPTHLLPALRRAAVDVVADRLARAEPPLRAEAVHYLLRDPSAHPSPAVPEFSAYSRRRSLAAWARLRDVLAPVAALAAWLRGVRDWKHPPTTVLVQLLLLMLTWHPKLILPTFFLYLIAAGALNYFRRRPAGPARMEHYADGVHPGMLEEEFDAGPASGTPPHLVEWRYLQLREAAARVQTLIGDVATQGERAHALLAWRDGRATAVALAAAAALAAVTYAVPFRALVAAAGLYATRHPLLRRRKGRPSALMCFFRRLPSNADVLL